MENEKNVKLPEPGLYRHFKGHVYDLLDIATHSETGELMAVYRACYNPHKLYVRPLAMWSERIDRGGYHGPRFRRMQQ